MTLRIDRLDGERLTLDGYGLARGFFRGDPSSVAPQSFDSLAGRGARNQITTADIIAINTTMRARSSHARWEPIANRDLSWLAAIDPELDLLADDDVWTEAGGALLLKAALHDVIGPGRGPSVATKASPQTATTVPGSRCLRRRDARHQHARRRTFWRRSATRSRGPNSPVSPPEGRRPP